MALVPTGGVVRQDVVVAIVIEVDSIVTVRVGGVACKGVSARIVEVDSVGIF